LQSKIIKMDLRSLLVLLVVCLAIHLEGASAQYGSSPSNGAPGVVGAGYSSLGVAAALLAIAALVFN
jgi:hypothetical protein